MRNLLRSATMATLACLFLAATMAPASAGWRRSRAAQSTCANGSCAAPAQYAAPVQYAAPTRYAAPACANGTCAAPVQYAAPQAYTTDGRALYHPVYRVATPSVVGQVARAANPLAWVNHYRTMHGLRALAYDANLSAYAASNNAACASRGLGHFVMAGCAQNAAGTSDPAYAAQLWYQSPAHNANMLNPSATCAGIDCSNGYATLNVR